MRFKLSAGLLSLAATILAAAPLFVPSSAQQQQQQQQDDQDVTESFTTTRGAAFGDRPKKPANANTSASAQPKKPAKFSGGINGKVAKGGNDKTNPPSKGSNNTAANKSNAAPKNTPTPGGPNATTHHAAKQSDEPRADEPTNASASSPAGAVGLGYTIFMVGADGSNTVVDPSRSFTAGDRIRVALETNADGFLYIFNSENDRPEALMLYPHVLIDRGANKLAAHARDYFPADLRYSFEFDDAKATEHLYVIFSRRPLADVPTGEALLEYCGATKPDECYWRPTPEQWAQLKTAAAAGRVVESRNRDLAGTTPLPSGALTRGIKVKRDEPAPAVVRMNASADADVLLTKIELIHK